MSPLASGACASTPIEDSEDTGLAVECAYECTVAGAGGSMMSAKGALGCGVFVVVADDGEYARAEGIEKRAALGSTTGADVDGAGVVNKTDAASAGSLGDEVCPGDGTMFMVESTNESWSIAARSSALERFASARVNCSMEKKEI